MNLTKLKEVLEYSADQGAFYWLEEKQGRSMDKPAGTTNHDGYRTIRIDGTSYSQARLAWLFMTGEWPTRPIGYRNDLSSDITWTNLYEMSRDDQKRLFREKSEKLTKTTTPVVVRKSASFSNKAVTQAVEEFIKDKKLVNGRYI